MVMTMSLQPLELRCDKEESTFSTNLFGYTGISSKSMVKKANFKQKH